MFYRSITDFSEKLYDLNTLCYNVNTKDERGIMLMNTTVTFRTDEELKKKATALFDSMGMTLSTALNLFMTQAVLKKRFPCSLDMDIESDAAKSYPDYFFKLFGAGIDMGLDEEPEEIRWDREEIIL